jgi:type II secretory pathway component GspD/PulD (secretin)
MIARFCTALLAVALLACGSGPAMTPTVNASAGASDAQTFDFGPNEPMSVVITQLAMQSGLNLIPSPDLAGVMVTLHLPKLTPRAALTAIEAAYSLTEIAQGGVTIVVPRSKALDVETTLDTAALQTPPNLATSVAQLAMNVFPDVKAVATGTSSILATGSPGSLQRLKDMINTTASAYDKQTVRLSYTEPTDMIDKLKALDLVDNGINATANGNDESVTLVGPKSSLNSIAAAARFLDQQPRRAMFKVTVLETQPLNDSSNVGIVWGQPVGTTTTTSTTSSQQLTINPGSTATSAINIARMYLTQIPIGAQLNALISHGEGRVLAEPTILFNSDKPGTFNFIENYPIVTSTGGISPTSNTTYYPIGITLNLKGMVGEQGQITTDIMASDSSIIDFSPTSGLPIVGQRSTSGTVTVYKGESIVLAGFLDDEKSETVSKVPILGDIPIIGEFFKNRQKTHTRTELTFVIQPEYPPTPPTGS